MMKFLSLSIALILFSSNAFGSTCVSIGINNPRCKEPVLIDGKVEFVDLCADDEDCIDGKYCCPQGTKPSRYSRYSGQISRTGNGLTCRCPDNKYYAVGTGLVCADCPETSVWGKTDYGSPFGSRYYDSVNKEGCICEGYYDTMTAGCVASCDADVVKFSREGECCHPEEFYSSANSGCLCTLDYVKYTNDILYDGWENSLAKWYLDHGSLVVDDNRLVRFSDDYGSQGTCASDQCNGELWCEVGVMGVCCPCYDLSYEDGSLVNGDGECNYCPEGYIGGHTVEFIKDAVGKVDNNYYDTTEPCVKCDKYGGVWYPGSDNPDSDGYTMDSYCVFCPDGTSLDGKGEPYNGVEECRCPYYGQEYRDYEENKGCFCPPGTYLNLNESEGTCSPCGNSDGSDSDEYTGGWNNQTYCSKCSGQEALAIRTEPMYPVVLSEGNNDCVTCYYQYGAGSPYWNGNKCVPCYESISSGGEVWSDEYDEDGRCTSCSAKNYLYPLWNDESKQCEKCPAETPLWSTTAYYIDGQPQSGCVSCYEHHQDILKAYWNPYGFDSSGGICPTNDEGSLDCCTYCDNQTYDVNAGGCVNCYNSTACQECIAGGTNPAECLCIHDDFYHPGTCMDCLGYCSLSGNGELGVLDEYGTCSCQNCPMGSVFNSGRCIADPSACPDGYAWNSSVGCCWDPNMNYGSGDCMEGSCPGTTYWNGNCCWDPDIGMCR